jgi:hypothetical protein
VRPRRGGPGLVPLASLDRRLDRGVLAEARLRRSWLLVVGPVLVNQTRLVRARRGILVVGCWHPEVIPSLRQSAAAVWPEVSGRLERFWKLKFQRMEIVPCDPPEPAEAQSRPRDPDRDPLKDVLELLRRQRKEG